MARTFSENSHDNLRVEGPTSEMVFLPADAYSSSQNISELTNIINSTHYVHIRIGIDYNKFNCIALKCINITFLFIILKGNKPTD